MIVSLMAPEVTEPPAPGLPRCRSLFRAITNYSVFNNKQNLITMAYVIGDDCIACGTCIDECPVGAISEGDKYSINPDMCTECGTCADVCPSEAIHLG